MGVCVLANFSKTAERNKTLFTGIQVRLRLSSNQQTDQKSVYSTRRYSNIKVPYQMSKLTKYGSCFAKIHHLDYIKLHTKYIWGDSPLTEDFKTPNFHNIVQSFKVSTGSPAGVNRFWGLNRGQVYWPISLKRLNQNKHL